MHWEGGGGGGGLSDFPKGFEPMVSWAGRGRRP